MQSSGLQERYKDDAEFSLLVRMLPALAFVPVEKVCEVFDNLEEEVKEEVQPLLDYFEDTFIGRRQRRGRRAPLFPHIMWNCKDKVENGLPRTNNHVEGWHQHMQANVSSYHTNIFQFSCELKREQALNKVKQARMTAGKNPPSQKRKYVAVTNRL